MIDLDKLEELAKAATTGLPGDRIQFSLAVLDPAAILKLIAEMRRLRTEINDFTTQCGELNEEVVRLRGELSAPQHTHCQLGEMAGYSADGAHHQAAETAFMNHPGALVTVYYGTKRVYATMAAFEADHPRG